MAALFEIAEGGVLLAEELGIELALPEVPEFLQDAFEFYKKGQKIIKAATGLTGLATKFGKETYQMGKKIVGGAKEAGSAVSGFFKRMFKDTTASYQHAEETFKGNRGSMDMSSIALKSPDFIKFETDVLGPLTSAVNYGDVKLIQPIVENPNKRQRMATSIILDDYVSKWGEGSNARPNTTRNTLGTSQVVAAQAVSSVAQERPKPTTASTSNITSTIPSSATSSVSGSARSDTTTTVPSSTSSDASTGRAEVGTPATAPAVSVGHPTAMGSLIGRRDQMYRGIEAVKNTVTQDFSNFKNGIKHTLDIPSLGAHHHPDQDSMVGVPRAHIGFPRAVDGSSISTFLTSIGTAIAGSTMVDSHVAPAATGSNQRGASNPLFSGWSAKSLLHL